MSNTRDLGRAHCRPCSTTAVAPGGLTGALCTGTWQDAGAVSPGGRPSGPHPRRRPGWIPWRVPSALTAPPEGSPSHTGGCRLPAVALTSRPQLPGTLTRLLPWSGSDSSLFFRRACPSLPPEELPRATVTAVWARAPPGCSLPASDSPSATSNCSVPDPQR